MAQFELIYGKGLMDLFISDSGAFTLIALFVNILEAIDGYTYGAFAGIACLLVIWLIYQKTDSIVSVYFVAIIALNVLRDTMFAQVSTLVFYIVALSITAVLFSLIKGRS